MSAETKKKKNGFTIKKMIKNQKILETKIHKQKCGKIGEYAKMCGKIENVIYFEILASK